MTAYVLTFKHIYKEIMVCQVASNKVVNELAVVEEFP